eukprot:5540523-Prymnesium_polylepis.1
MESEIIATTAARIPSSEELSSLGGTATTQPGTARAVVTQSYDAGATEGGQRRRARTCVKGARGRRTRGGRGERGGRREGRDGVHKAGARTEHKTREHARKGHARERESARGGS